MDTATGRAPDAGQRLRDLVEEIALADAVGLDVFGVGEHHRPDYAVSSPAVVLAAAAGRTKRIKLTTAVTVLSSDDPVRVFQDFATLDQISEGRAEITAGRGSFIESFPLFGYNLDDYNELFTEKLDLLLKLRDEERVSWAGRHRPALDDQAIYPRPYQKKLPIWVAIGGTPSSAARAARLGLPMAVAIIGGEPVRFAPLLDYYRDQAIRAGRDPAQLPISINSHGFVAETTDQAADDFFLPLKSVMDRLGAERGWAPMTRADYDQQRGPHGALLVGSPEQVAEKILFQHTVFRHQRFLLQVSVGPMSHAKVMKAIELFGTRTAPIVRAEVARRGY
ncbi:LLM class flavin-dependent oxidoreductase [Acidisoma cellulosilytica]|uniref:LLM class flavin-dependent oxidoreductase n=1 Tax=Acidisoma cellulosilyticum TaxID=2802395 RepID=A0A963Z5Y1_9PROT|nr:LLM class flavin-dependent oxidoreductase [Acidisoma cellulosilyticum]